MLFELPVEPTDLVEAVVAPFREENGEPDDVLRIEPRVEGVECGEALEEKPGAHEEESRKSGLDYQKQAPKPLAPRPRRARACETGTDGSPQQRERGRGTDEKRHRDKGCESEPEDLGVDRNRLHPR